MPYPTPQLCFLEAARYQRVPLDSVERDDRLLVKLLPSSAPQSEIRVMLGSRR